MKLFFLSNYFNHHQKYISEEFDKICDSYTFLATSKMREDRKKLGYGEIETPAYVIEYTGEKQIEKMINNCDVVLLGAAPYKLIKKRVTDGNVIFRYSERPLKTGNNILKYVPRFFKWHKEYPNKGPIYLLCSSAYALYDYNKFALFKNKGYKWGYFPEAKTYNIKSLLDKKKKTRILWCGRFLKWKRPKDVVEVAKRLKVEGYCFEMNFIGAGELQNTLQEIVVQLELEDCVNFLGAMPPEKVRHHMENAGIYVFSSNQREGWGAVLNESMNSACAVVASHAIGAVPYLIKNNENGLIYKSGDVDMLFRKVKFLLDNPQEQERLGKAAYQTIIETWNAEVAAQRFINLAQHILDGEKSPDLYEYGPCSKAEIIKDDWFYE